MTPNQPSESPKRNVYDQWVFDTFGVDPSTYPPVRAAADAPPVSPDAAAIAQGMAIAREAGPGQGVQVAQLAVPGLPLPLPIPPDALPAPLSPAVAREVAHAFGRAGRRLVHIAGEIAHGDLADAAGQAFLGRPFPPQVDDPGLAPPARPVPPNPGTTPLGDEQCRAMGRPEGFSGDAEAGQPDVEGFSGTPALPIVLAGPRVDGGAAGPMVVASQSDPGLTRPSGPINGRPAGQRSVTEKNAAPGRKAQVDSENQVADAYASAGYTVSQNPTDGPNPILTPERMVRDSLNPRKRPDLLIENRVFDIYTPETDVIGGIWEGIEEKIADQQTHRVVVDLRNTTQTDASLRAALQAEPIQGLREVFTLSKNGLGRAFP